MFLYGTFMSLFLLFVHSAKEIVPFKILFFKNSLVLIGNDKNGIKGILFLGIYIFEAVIEICMIRANTI